MAHFRSKVLVDFLNSFTQNNELTGALIARHILWRIYLNNNYNYTILHNTSIFKPWHRSICELFLGKKNSSKSAQKCSVSWENAFQAYNKKLWERANIHCGITKKRWMWLRCLLNLRTKSQEIRTAKWQTNNSKKVMFPHLNKDTLFMIYEGW